MRTTECTDIVVSNYILYSSHKCLSVLACRPDVANSVRCHKAASMYVIHELNYHSSPTMEIGSNESTLTNTFMPTIMFISTDHSKVRTAFSPFCLGGQKIQCWAKGYVLNFSHHLSWYAHPVLLLILPFRVISFFKRFSIYFFDREWARSRLLAEQGALQGA